MSAPPRGKLVGTYLPTEVADRFEAWARPDGGKAAALRRLISEALDGGKTEVLHGARLNRSALAPAGVGRGQQVAIRLKAPDRRALNDAAAAFGSSPANWLRSLALVHLTRKPQWNTAELEELRTVFRELRAIGNNVNQIARALNIAVQSGDYPAGQGQAALEAAELIRSEMRRVVAVMTGNFDYWGLPDTERPTAAPGAVERADAAAISAEQARKRRPRKRPARFQQGGDE